MLNSLGNLEILYKVNIKLCDTCADNTGEDSHLVFSWVKDKLFVVLYSGVLFMQAFVSVTYNTHTHRHFKVLDTWV